MLLLAMLVSVLSFSQSNSGLYDPFHCGAKGDGQTNDTEAIQKAIDHSHLAGGGKVFLHSGRFVFGTAHLKSNVTLYIEAGAVLWKLR
jgi:polygalacturonase